MRIREIRNSLLQHQHQSLSAGKKLTRQHKVELAIASKQAITAEQERSRIA